jgi:hypothetical protein
MRDTPPLGTVEISAAESPETKQNLVNWQVIGQEWESYLDEAGDEWREAFLPAIEGVAVANGEVWNVVLGTQFNVRNILAETWLDNYMLGFADDILVTTRARTAELLQYATQEGWSIPVMQGWLEVLFKHWITGTISDEEREQLLVRLDPWRTEVIARTETMRAVNASSLPLFEGFGANYKEWLDIRDNREREAHQIAGESYQEGGSPGPIPLDEAFIVGGEPMMYPHDPSASASNVCNCRCTVGPLFLNQ